jgi:hypothetical protein
MKLDDKSLSLEVIVPNTKLEKENPKAEVEPSSVWHIEDVKIVLNEMAWYFYALMVAVALFLLWSVWYYRRYKNPLIVKLTKNPNELLNLPHAQLPQAKKRLQNINQLETTLAKAEVSPKILQNAIEFTSTDNLTKITTIAQRVGARLKQHKSYYELRLAENFPLSVDGLSVKFIESQSVIDVKDEVRDSGILEGRIVLLLASEEMMHEIYREITSDKTNMWVTLRGSDLTRLLLSPKPKEILAEIISSQIALTQISPYQIGGGVNRESIFFGRERIISHILNKGVSNYIIIGGRQVGKSSLLKAIERRYEQIEGVECYYISASNENLIEDIKLELDQEELSDKAFAKFINTSSKRYLFLIDEADDFIRYEQQYNYSSLKFMRSLSEKNNASFILAGFWETYRYTFFDYQSPIKNFASIFELEELEYEACVDLATKPMQSLGLGYETKESVEWMIEKVGQRANLIQIVCDYLVESIPPNQRLITQDDITQALRNKKLLKFFDDWNEMSTDTKEKWIDRVVLYGTIGQDRFDDSLLQRLIRENGLEINSNELDKSLVRLRLGYIVKKVDEGYVYGVPLFVENIRRLNLDERFLEEIR